MRFGLRALARSYRVEGRVLRHVVTRTRVAAWAVISLAALNPVFASGVGAAIAPTLTLSEISHGRTFVVAPGEHVTLTRHSTYWNLLPLATQRSLRQSGATKVVGVLAAASHCVPGQGCGTVSAHYVALAPGLVRLCATRTGCGEALRCSPAQSSWTALIRIR